MRAVRPPMANLPGLPMVSVDGMDTLATQNALAQTIAHELGHALGLSPNDDHSTADNNLMKATLEPDDRTLDAAQCQLLSASLQAHIRRGCP